MTDPIDFTPCERLPGRAYNGANGKKIGYVDFISENRETILEPSLKRIVSKIDMEAIGDFIGGMPLLTDLQRCFYKTYPSARYEALFVA